MNIICLSYPEADIADLKLFFDDPHTIIIHLGRIDYSAKFKVVQMQNF